MYELPISVITSYLALASALFYLIFSYTSFMSYMNKNVIVLPPIYGTWTIKISGSGFEGVGALVYSGNYDITVESERLN